MNPVLLRVQTIPSPLFGGPACYGIHRFGFTPGDPIPSLPLGEGVVTGASTPMPRRCRSTSAAKIRFVFEWFRGCEGIDFTRQPEEFPWSQPRLYLWQQP